MDGTLVTKEKILTDRAKDAVKKMREAGIEFAITSGRPPRGMQMLIEPLAITTPIAAFNGGLFVKPDLSIIEERVLNKDVVEPVIKIIEDHKLDVWIYRKTDWFVHERHGAHVDREEWTVKFSAHRGRQLRGKDGRGGENRRRQRRSRRRRALAKRRCAKHIGPQIGAQQSTPSRDGTNIRRSPRRARSPIIST